MLADEVASYKSKIDIYDVKYGQYDIVWNRYLSLKNENRKLLKQLEEQKTSIENMITIEQADLLVEAYKSVVSELQDFFGTPHIQEVIAKLEEQKELVEFSKAIKFAYEQYDEPDVQNIDGNYEIWISKEKQWYSLVDWYRQQKEGK